MTFWFSLILRATVLLSLGLAGNALARRSAVLRHRIWATLLAGVVLLPLAMATLPAVPFPWPEGNLAVSDRHSAISSQRSAFNNRQAAESVPVAPGRRYGPGWPAGTELIALAWGLGSAWFLGRLGWGWLGLRELQRGARPVDGQLREELRLAQTSMSCARRAKLVALPANCVPQVGGLFRPVIFLPESAVTWPRERLRLALRHELAHVRRGDCAWMLLAGVAQAMWWPHPLIHLAVRSMRLGSEQACDDAVVSAGGVDRRDYARELVEFARTLTVSPAASGVAFGMVGTSQLGRRVTSLLDGERPRTAARGALLAATWLGAGVIALAASAVPRQTAQAPLPSFEAASVKPVQESPGTHVSEHGDQGHLYFMTNLHQFIIQSYGLTPKQLGPEPGWFYSRFFAIDAVTSKPATNAQMMLMVRRLLQARFHLVLRNEPREMPVYFLEVAPGGVKFKALEPGEKAVSPEKRSGYFSRYFPSIPILVDNLNQQYGGPLQADRTVIDRTGLTGQYDIELSTLWSHIEGIGRGEFPNLPHDLEAQDGLRLVKGQARLPYYVVVSASLPTPD